MNIFSRISNLFTHGPLAYIGIIVLAILLRIPLLTGSFWLDEAAQALEVVRPWSQQLDISADFQPPFFHLLLHLWQYGGHEEWWLRLISVFAGLASIAVAMRTSAKWQGKKASLFVGLLLATSSLHIFFSQELRPYMLAVWWGSLSLSLYLELLWQSPSSSQVQRKKSWNLMILLFTLSNALGALTSYVYLFWLMGLLMTTWLFHRRQAWLITRSLAVTSLWWFTWYLGLLDQLEVSAALRAAVPGWENVVSLTQMKAVPLTLGKFVMGIVPLDMQLKDVFIVFLPFASAFYLALKDWQSNGKSAKWRSITFVSLFVFPLVFGWLFSFWTPVISPKRVLFLLPVLYLIFGQIWEKQSQKGAEMVFVLLLIVNVLGLTQYWMDSTLQRENWRQAVTLIESRFSPSNSMVVFGFDAPFAPWVWYQTENIATLSTGFAPLDTIEETENRLTVIPQYENVLLFEYLLDLSDPQRNIAQVILKKGFEEQEVLDFSQLGFIRVFHQQKLYAHTK